MLRTLIDNLEDDLEVTYNTLHFTAAKSYFITFTN